MLAGRESYNTDTCGKEFPESSKFWAGLYTICCGHGYTLGCEVMIDHEGPKNLFRFLQCRDVNIASLEGIIIDHACKVDSYIMNREAALLEYKLLLVDDAHWEGMKKLKKSVKRSAGYLGCPSSFNFNLYKKFLYPNPPNSESSAFSKSIPRLK